MMARLTDVRLTAPACPRDGNRLDGGPIVFWCPSGHGVQAADLDNEFIPAAPVLYNVPVIALFAYAAASAWLNLVFLAVK